MQKEGNFIVDHGYIGLEKTEHERPGYPPASAMLRSPLQPLVALWSMARDRQKFTWLQNGCCARYTEDCKEPREDCTIIDEGGHHG